MMTFIKPSITYLVAQHPLCKHAVLAHLSWMVLMTFSPIHPRWVLEAQTHSFWCTLSDQSRRHPHSSHPSLSSPKSGSQLRKEEPWSLGSSAGSWANTHTAARQEAQQTSFLFPGDCGLPAKGIPRLEMQSHESDTWLPQASLLPCSILRYLSLLPKVQLRAFCCCCHYEYRVWRFWWQHSNGNEKLRFWKATWYG